MLFQSYQFDLIYITCLYTNTVMHFIAPGKHFPLAFVS